MNKKRRIILRTEIFERISLRKTSETVNHQTFAFGTYKIEISKVDAEVEQSVFDAEFPGLLEIKETSEEIRIVYRKK